MLRTLRIPLVLALAVLVLGATCTTHQQLMGSGTALKAVGQQWLAVNGAFVKACLPSAPKLPKATCDEAGKFHDKFKKSYPLAIDLYETAVNANDTAMAGDAKNVIKGLSRDLVKFGLQVGIQLSEVK